MAGESIGDLLLRRGVVDETGLDRARERAAQTGATLGRSLVALRLVTEQQVAAALAADDAVAPLAEPRAGGVAPPAADQPRPLDLSALLSELLDLGGSDLHLTAGSPPVARVDGELTPLGGYPMLKPPMLEALAASVLTDAQWQVFERDMEFDVAYQLRGRARFRVNLFRQRNSIGAVMRAIPFEITPLDQLGLPPQIRELADLPRGFVLVTGPTGSGKTTTLAALLDVINSERAVHIMTVEDPIEFLHRHRRSLVNQRELGTDTHSFAAALKHVLRQDPDVLLVGELRDLETIQMALTAAETGHLVFGTLHTQDAPQTIDRVVDVFPPDQQEQIRIQLSGTLQAVVCQQLLRTADGQGRVPACEVMIATPAVRNLIREGKVHQIYSLIQAGRAHGMVAMDQALADLVTSGRVDYDAALERANQVTEFARLCGRRGP